MAGNQWGAQNSLPLPAVYNPTGDISCTSSTATTVVTSGALSTVVPGFYYPELSGVLSILLGATAPSALVISFILGAGSIVDSYTVPPALLTNNATLMVPVALIGASSQSAWAGSGSTVNVQVNATGQAVTCKQVGSRVIVQLFRGPDV